MESFSCKSKASISCIPMREEHAYGGYSQKAWKLFQVSMLISSKGWTLISRKMVERKAFLQKLKPQHYVFQSGEHAYGG